MIKQPLTISTTDAETQFIIIASLGGKIRVSFFSFLVVISSLIALVCAITTLSVIGMVYAVQETPKVRWNIMDT